MLDIKFIKEHKEAVADAVIKKNIDLDIDKLLILDKKRLELLQETEQLLALKNDLNEMIKAAKDDEERKEIIEKGKEIKADIEKIEPQYKKVKEEFDELMVKVPNIISVDTPVGKSDEDNVEIERSGKIPTFNFPIKDHVQLGKDLDILDLEKGTKVAGFRGYYMKNEGASLMMALMMYAMNKLIEKGYAPMIPPTLVKGSALFGTGYFKGREYDPETDEVYQVASKDKESSGETSREKKFLVGTAEPSLLAYYADEVLKEEQVVLMAADEEASIKMPDDMLEISKEDHKELGLPYRVLKICSGDMSAGKFRAYDIEAWMPSRDGFGETGSASNFLDWQARRLNVKYVDKNGEKKHVFMLNNTVLPSPRPFIAILENFQQADGSVVIPEVLRKYMPGGISTIFPKK